MPRKLASIVPLALLSITGASPQPAQTIRIVGTDYAFQVPEHIRAGETIFTFDNRGSVRHEMTLALLKPGFRADSILASTVAGSSRREWREGQAGVVVSRPGDSPGPGVWLNLEVGRTYFVLCTLRDRPDAQPHLMLGMVATFRVEP
jgi:hypothetical protein